jgi:hypothetical protein
MLDFELTPVRLTKSTFLAEPGHPVLLDVLGRIMRDVQNGRTVNMSTTAAAKKGPEEGRQSISDDTLMDIVVTFLSLFIILATNMVQFLLQLDFTGPGVLYVHSSFDTREKG